MKLLLILLHATVTLLHAEYLANLFCVANVPAGLMSQPSSIMASTRIMIKLSPFEKTPSCTA